MSKVSRNVYQKVCEENKRLKKDIKVLVSGLGDYLEVLGKWQVRFAEEEQFNKDMKIVVREYIKDHPEHDITKYKTK